MKSPKTILSQIERYQLRGDNIPNNPRPVLPVDMSQWVNRIICGDSVEVLPNIPTDSIDLVLTSPPYNFALLYGDDPTSDCVAWDQYFDKLNKIWGQCYRILKPGGRICINIMLAGESHVPTHHLISHQLLQIGFLWYGDIVWYKQNYNCRVTAWGSWKSPSAPRFKNNWELIEIFCKESYKKAGDSSKIDITRDEFIEWTMSHWNLTPNNQTKIYQHPAMFPEKLVARLIKLLTFQDDIVLDPFNGSGTTTAVAQSLKRRYIGIEIVPKYCDIALRRLNIVSLFD